MKLPFILLSILLILNSGCAYKLGSVGDPGFKKLFIENFKNEADEPRLENIVTTTIIQQFHNDGTIEIVPASEADVILRGTITQLTTSPVRFARSNEITPTEVNLSIIVQYTLTKKGESKPYRKATASGASRFFIGDDLQSDKRQGIPLAAEKIGQSIISTLVETW
jgi:hypothetical protein